MSGVAEGLSRESVEVGDGEVECGGEGVGVTDGHAVLVRMGGDVRAWEGPEVDDVEVEESGCDFEEMLAEADVLLDALGCLMGGAEDDVAPELFESCVVGGEDDLFDHVGGDLLVEVGEDVVVSGLDADLEAGHAGVDHFVDDVEVADEGSHMAFAEPGDWAVASQLLELAAEFADSREVDGEGVVGEHDEADVGPLAEDEPDFVHDVADGAPADAPGVSALEAERAAEGASSAGEEGGDAGSEEGAERVVRIGEGQLIEVLDEVSRRVGDELSVLEEADAPGVCPVGAVEEASGDLEQGEFAFSADDEVGV